MDKTASLTPQLEVKVNNILWTQSHSAIKADLISAVVTEDMEAPGMFAITLKTRDLLSGEYTWVDDSLFAVGNTIEIRMGDGIQIDTLMVGEITGLEPEYEQNQVPTLVVRGYDLRHRLMRGQKTRSFTKMKDSAIASQIASDLRLGSQVKPTQVELDYVLQHNQTDLEFLQSRAKRIGYEVSIKRKVLYFQPHDNTTSKVLTLTYGKNLLSFSPRLSAMNQNNAVEVRGWDVKQKKSTIGKAEAKELSLSGSDKISGLQSSKKVFGQASRVIVTEPMASVMEAKQVAKGQLESMALAYITGQATCLGNPKVRAGQVLEILGVGQRFGGSYYVTAVTHIYERQGGYRTEFEVRRNAT